MGGNETFKGYDKTFLANEVFKKLKKEQYFSCRKLAKEIGVKYMTLNNFLKILGNRKILIKVEVGVAGPYKRYVWILK